MPQVIDTDKLGLIASVAGAFLRCNPCAIGQISMVVGKVTRALDEAANGGGEGQPTKQVSSEATTVPAVPAVPIAKSVHSDHLFCLDCGASFKTLKRHLGTSHSLTPEEYRAK